MITLEKIEYRCRKGIVGIANHHMCCLCDVGVFSVWNKFEQLRDRVFGNQIARSAANNMQWQRKPAGCIVQRIKLAFLMSRIASLG